MILCHKDVYYDIEYRERNHIVSGSSGLVITIVVRADRAGALHEMSGNIKMLSVFYGCMKL